MDEDKIQFLKQFIDMYEKATDKQVFIQMWKMFVNNPNEPLSLRDAYDAVYGEAIAQILEGDD